MECWSRTRPAPRPMPSLALRADHSLARGECVRELESGWMFQSRPARILTAAGIAESTIFNTRR